MGETPRFYAMEGDLDQPAIALAEEDAVHIRRVLRLRPGDRITVCDGRGRQALCVLDTVEARAVTARVEQRRAMDTDPRLRLCCYPSLSKGERFESMLQKLCELGVTEVTPVISERCVVRELSELKWARLRRILLEAAKQCGRSVLPALREPVPFDRLIGSRGPGIPLFCYEEAEDSLRMVWESLERTDMEAVPTVHLLTGPEGGYSPREAALARAAGWRSVSLGRIILRCETAPVAAAAALLYAAGQM